MKLTTPVLLELEHAEVKGNTVRLVRQIDRTLYAAVNKALECLGGKWSRKEKAHVFESEPWESIADAVATGEVIDPKKEFQFFETPEGLAGQMVQAARMTRDHSVLEPSAGRGRIVKAIQQEFPEKGVDVAELMPENRKVLSAMPHVHIMAEDFLTMQPPSGWSYDRIIANPPFRKNQDIWHIMKMFSLLKQGGRLVTITSPGWTFRTDRLALEFKAMLENIGAEWDTIPEGTFKESGTMVRSILLEVDKP